MYHFGGTYTKIGNDTEKISMAPAQGWHAKSWSVPYFLSYFLLIKNHLNKYLDLIDHKDE